MPNDAIGGDRINCAIGGLFPKIPYFIGYGFSCRVRGGPHNLRSESGIAFPSLKGQFRLVIRLRFPHDFPVGRNMRPRAATEPQAVIAFKPMRIVVVDDHIFMRDLMSSTLNRQEANYSVVASVGNGAEAIEACKKFRPDLLILDINLPDQTGIDTVPAIRRVSPETNVLLCTAFPTEDLLADALRAGAKGFVEKTNTWDDFLHAVDRGGRGSNISPPRAMESNPSRAKRSSNASGATSACH